jgi:hypothetical protein
MEKIEEDRVRTCGGLKYGTAGTGDQILYL